MLGTSRGIHGCVGDADWVGRKGSKPKSPRKKQEAGEDIEKYRFSQKNGLPQR
jgi:hypothetical protein